MMGTTIAIDTNEGKLEYVIGKEGITHIFTDSEGKVQVYQASHEEVIEAIKELQ